MDLSQTQSCLTKRCAWAGCRQPFQAQRASARFCCGACQRAAHRKANGKRPTMVIMYNGCRGHVRDPRDLYTEPVAATAALLEVERFPERILDPACGAGNVIEACRAAGYGDVRGSDLAYGQDFLIGQIPSVGSIISNPPYRVAEQFALRALEGATHVALLLHDSNGWAAGSGTSGSSSAGRRAGSGSSSTV